MGDCQGVEAPWPLVSAQKDAKNKYKSLEDTKRKGSTRAGEEGARRTGGQDTRDLRRKYPWERQVPDRRLRPAGEGGGLSKWW